jgi:hypothetical protein
VGTECLLWTENVRCSSQRYDSVMKACGGVFCAVWHGVINEVDNVEQTLTQYVL